MSTTVSWSSATGGDWSVGLDWSGFQPPRAGQDVQISGAVTVTIDSAAAAADVTLGDGTTLDVDAALTLSGTLTGGVLDLAGTLAGGTLDATDLVGSGGTLQGVTVLGGMTRLALGYIAIDPATAASFGQSITVSGTLTLEAGLYDGVTFAQMSGFSYYYGLAGAGGAVTLGPQAVVTNLGVWSGDLVNQGTIGNGPATTLSIVGGSFTNDGTVSLTPVTTSASEVVSSDIYHWTISTAPTVAIGATAVDNSGLIALVGGTLTLSGATLDNSGTIALTDGSTQVFDNAGTNSAVVTLPLTTAVTLGAPFSDIHNTGTISADLIDFAGPVALASLGTLKGALRFDSVLDLGGGTLDASSYGTVRIDGEVTNGTLMAGTGTLILAGATLNGVSIAAGGSVAIDAPLALVGVPAGASQVVLGATTSELILPAAASLAGVTITAGGAGIADTLSLPGGTVTLAPGASIALVGGTLGVLGPGTLEDDGAIMVAAGTLNLAAPLDGAGTIALAAGTMLHDTGLLGGALVVTAGSDSVLSLATLGANADVTVGAGASLSVGTLDGNAAITVDVGARLSVGTLAGTPTIDFAGTPALVVLPGTGALAVTLANLGAGDLVDFAAVSGVPSGAFGEGGAAESAGSLDVTGASGQTATVPLSRPAAGLGFGVTIDTSGGTLVTAMACFRAGTRIATARGAVPVERLRRGERVRTANGRLVPITWLGRSRVDCRVLARPEDGWPVRVAAHAFAPGRPARDLYLSPDHAVWLQGALVPVRYLLNGATIAQRPVARVEYWHVALPAHDVLLAENLPAESYLDTGNRAAFERAARRHALPPLAALRVWRRRGCAPLLTHGPRLAAAHARLLARARALGHALTDAPSVRVLSDRGRATPCGGLHFRLPPGAGAVRLISRSFVPAHLAGTGHDPRRLGVAVRRVLLDGATLPLDDPRLGAGWHAPEAGWRWTAGDAVIAAAGARELAIDLAITGQYWRA